MQLFVMYSLAVKFGCLGSATPYFSLAFHIETTASSQEDECSCDFCTQASPYRDKTEKKSVFRDNITSA